MVIIGRWARSLEAAGLAGRLVGQCDRLEIADFRLRAVAVADSGEPFAGVELLRRHLAFPRIDAAGDLAAAGADKLFAEKAGNFEKVWGDLGEVRAAFFEADGGR